MKALSIAFFSLWWLPCAAAAEGPAAPASEGARSSPPSLNVVEGRVLDEKDRPVPFARVALALAGRGFISYQGRSNMEPAWGPPGPDLNVFGSDERFLLFFPKRNGRVKQLVVADAEGRYRATGLKRGKLNIMAVSPEEGAGFLLGVEYPEAGESLDIKLVPTAVVEGRIQGLRRPDGFASVSRLEPAIPLDGISMGHYLRGDTSEGFRISGVSAQPSEWKLSFTKYIRRRAFSATILEVPVSVKAGATSTVALDLGSGHELSGEIRGPKDEPLEFVSVVAKTHSDRPIKYGGISDAAGRYAIAGLPPGKYTLELRRWARRTAPG